MLDLHCHILPGVDDGAKSLDVSLAMARFYAADGVTHVVATPHCNRSWRLLRAEVVPRVAQLNEAIAAADIPLTVLPGSEIQIVNSTAYRAEYEAGLYCHLGDRPAFTLLEFNWVARNYPADAVALVRWLRDRGTTPIIAHPERHEFFVHEPIRLRKLVDAGAWVQITVDSLLGVNGPMSREAGEAMLRTYPDAVLASDAHSMRRCSGLKVGFVLVNDWLGPDREQQLRANADRVLTAMTAPG
ncbi:tyrosine-protein phosphatase [Limnoglobus roseus]|uniref:tyrosine-protein phosphatase n=1 Tax=Limnoglobus roseus TaxID=2598579 RepID=UPI00143D2983|nr:CpsB/CapC family capsule biosynthesis tyrosine phosphatase [Limnoglobus roseus]